MKKNNIIILVFALLFLGCEKREAHTASSCSNFQYAHKDGNFSQNISKELTELSCSHLQYWEYRSKKEFEKSYNYELPYQRFIYSNDWYKRFHSPDEGNFSILQVEIIQKSPEFAEIKTKKILKDGYSYTFLDKWYRVGNKWYHKMKTTYLPIEIED